MQYTEIENIRPTLSLVWHDLGRALPVIAASRGIIRVDGSTGATEVEALGPNRWRIEPAFPEKPFETPTNQVVTYLQKIPNISRVYYKPTRTSSSITILWDRRRPTTLTPTILPTQPPRAAPAPAYIPPQPTRPVAQGRPAAPAYIPPQPSQPAARAYVPSRPSRPTPAPLVSTPRASHGSREPLGTSATVPSGYMGGYGAERRSVSPIRPRESFFAPSGRPFNYETFQRRPELEPAAYPSTPERREERYEEPRGPSETRERPGLRPSQSQAHQWALQRAASQRQTLEQANAQGRYPPASSYQPATRSTYSPRQTTPTAPTTPSRYSAATTGVSGKGSWGRIQLPRIPRSGERADEA
jgi:hypothetical protein